MLKYHVMSVLEYPVSVGGHERHDVFAVVRRRDGHRAGTAERGLADDALPFEQHWRWPLALAAVPLRASALPAAHDCPGRVNAGNAGIAGATGTGGGGGMSAGAWVATGAR